MARRIEQFNRRSDGFVWHTDDRGRTVITQEERPDGDHAFGLYTLRHSENNAFPFDDLQKLLEAAEHCGLKRRAELLPGGPDDELRQLIESAVASRDAQRFLDVADALEAQGRRDAAILATLREADLPIRACCLAEWILDEPRGTLIKRFAADGTNQIATVYQIEISLPIHKRGFVEAKAGEAIRQLNRALRGRKLGSAEVHGSSGVQEADGQTRYVKDYVSVSIRGDLQAGIALIREVLSAAKAPKSTRIELESPWTEKIPFQIVDA